MHLERLQVLPAVGCPIKYEGYICPHNVDILLFSFLVIRSNHILIKQLVAHAQIIIQLWWKHGVLGWSNYNSRFRQQLAAGIQLDWTTVEWQPRA